MAAETTPPLRDAQKPCGGHPSCDGTADPGTVGQWYPPVTGQWWDEQKGRRPNNRPSDIRPDSELKGWQPKETVP